MYELKVPAPEFILAALEAGKIARFEGAILILTRGLSISHQKELIESWSDLDDATHDDILILTFGVSKEYSGINAYSIGYKVVADEVSVAYPSSKSFYRNFEQLSGVAEYIPRIGDKPKGIIFDSHGATDIRRVLGLEERQLPAFFIVSYREGLEYVVELGQGEMQISPVKFISSLTTNLDDVPYKYRSLEYRATKLSKQRVQLGNQIAGKQRKLSNLDKSVLTGQLINHINQKLIDAPDDLKDIGKRMIEFLGGGDEELERIKYYESNLIRYAEGLSLDWLAKKLKKGVALRLENRPFQNDDLRNRKRSLELEISELNKRQEALYTEGSSLHRESASLKIETVFISAVEATLRQFRLELRSQDNQRKIQVPHIFSSFPRMTYSLSSKKDGPVTHNVVFISYSHKDAKWLERLQVHLKPLERIGTIARWDDTSIKPGSKWHEEIKNAVASAKVAVLLISADFLSSDFISTNELPPLLAAAETKGTIVLPVIVSPCLFQLTDSLSQFQSVNPLNRPLSKMTRNEQEEVFVKITETIENIFRFDS
jgi:hypothetical protein